MGEEIQSMTVYFSIYSVLLVCVYNYSHWQMYIWKDKVLYTFYLWQSTVHVLPVTARCLTSHTHCCMVSWSTFCKLSVQDLQQNRWNIKWHHLYRLICWHICGLKLDEGCPSFFCSNPWLAVSACSLFLIKTKMHPQSSKRQYWVRNPIDMTRANH